MSKAKIFEREVGVGLTKTFPEHLVYHESDFPVSWIKKGSPIKFKRHQAVDFLVLGRSINFAIEVKYTRKTTFPFRNVRKSQMNFLSQFQEKAGPSYIAIGIGTPAPIVNLISYNDFCSLQESIEKKSVNFKRDMGDFGGFFLALPRVKMRKNYYVDFTPLIKMHTP